MPVLTKKIVKTRRKALRSWDRHDKARQYNPIYRARRRRMVNAWAGKCDVYVAGMEKKADHLCGKHFWCVRVVDEVY